jgi:hypothetical protein
VDKGLTDNALWSAVDFTFNKSFWKKWGHGAALPFRVRNLVDLQRILLELSIPSCLYGRTLRDALNSGALMPDHDDDLLIDSENFPALMARASSKFLASGFDVIRNSSSIVSVCRDGRYIDIHPFDREIKEAPQVTLHGFHFHIHQDSPEILQEKYGEEPDATSQVVSLQLALSSARGGLEGLIKATAFALSSAENFRGALGLFLSELGRRLGSVRLAQASRRVPSALSVDDFLELKIDADDSWNWDFRGAHLKKVIRQGETFGQALSRLRNNLDFLEDSAVETPLDYPVEEPVNLSRSFWKRGDNLFIYPFLFGYRHLVLPYQAANLWILAARGPRLYSRQYWESLPAMSVLEIRLFLSNNPIEVTRGAVTSGRHRAIAMFGRIFRDEGYENVFMVRGNGSR